MGCFGSWGVSTLNPGRWQLFALDVCGPGPRTPEIIRLSGVKVLGVWGFKSLGFKVWGSRGLVFGCLTGWANMLLSCRRFGFWPLLSVGIDLTCTNLTRG